MDNVRKVNNYVTLWLMLPDNVFEQTTYFMAIEKVGVDIFDGRT
jgi:hypothetical protein